MSTSIPRTKTRLAAFSCHDAHDVLDGGNENLAVSHLAVLAIFMIVWAMRSMSSASTTTSIWTGSGCRQSF